MNDLLMADMSPEVVKFMMAATAILGLIVISFVLVIIRSIVKGVTK